MTGGEFARRLIGRRNVYLSNHSDRYDPITGHVYLIAETMHGKGMEALMVAAHECAHRMMHQRKPWTRRRLWRSFKPVHAWIEWKAWAMAYEMAKGHLREEDAAEAHGMRWRALSYL